MENNNDFFGSLNLEDLSSSDSDLFRLDDEPKLDVGGGIAKEKLTEISKKTFQLLDDENIFPFPENFESIFERVLKQEQDENVRNKILKHMQDRDTSTNVMELERSIAESFAHLKTMIEQVGVMCQNLQNLEHRTDDRLCEIDKIDNPLAIKNATRVLLNDVKATCAKTFDELRVLAKTYADVCENAQDLKKNAMFDAALGTYNKDFFMSMLGKECAIDEEFVVQGVIFVCEIDPNMFVSLPKSSQGMALKMAAKILTTQVGKTDKICYIGGGAFVIFMKNITREQADVCARGIIDALRVANVFINNTQVSLKAVIGATNFNCRQNPQENIDNAKNALNDAKAERKNYRFNSAKKELLQEEDDSLNDFGSFNLS